jgi:hypothetical protein
MKKRRNRLRRRKRYVMRYSSTYCTLNTVFTSIYKESARKATTEEKEADVEERKKKEAEVEEKKKKRVIDVLIGMQIKLPPAQH